MQDMKTRWSLALSLCRQDIQERFAGSLLGALWVFIWPLVQLFIYIIIFGKMMGGRFSGEAQIYSYGVYVASGLVSWTCFANTVLRSSRVLVEKRHVIAKVNVDLSVFPLFICLAELLPFAVSAVLLALVDVFSGWNPSPILFFYALLALYCQQMLAMGMGLLFAACAVFVRDAIETLAIIVQIGFWFTPIVYLPAILPEWVQSILVFNPMYHMTGIFQNFFVFGKLPSLSSILYIVALSHVVFAMSIWFMKKLEKDIRDVL